jgi:pimeloyl-ACP methyl ester carboxylesterase
MYRSSSENAKWNEAQTTPNSVPLTVVAAEHFFFAPLLAKFVEGYRAKGMVHVNNAVIPGAGHYLLADDPEAVGDLIEQYGMRGLK